MWAQTKEMPSHVRFFWLLLGVSWVHHQEATAWKLIKQSGLSIVSMNLPHGRMYLPIRTRRQQAARKRLLGPARRVLVSYANNCCPKSRKRLCVSALRHGADVCFSYNASVVSPEFRARNADILNRTRGGGYWLWKPYLIMKGLEMVDDGDLVLYSDTGLYFVNDTGPLWRMAMERRHPYMIGIAGGFQNKEYMKCDAYALMGCTDYDACVLDRQVIASAEIFRKSPRAMAIVSTWLTYAQDRRVITDDENEICDSNFKEFKDHRHDQSVLSLIASKWRLKLFQAFTDEHPLEYLKTVYHDRWKW